MSGTLDAIWRHPIKAVGRERVDEILLEAFAALPGDRIWGVAHEASKLEGGDWVRCANFSRAASAPALMAVELSRSGDRLRLTHPDRPELIVDPDESPETVAQWIAPLIPEGRARPVRTVRAAGQAFTDSRAPTISLGNPSSLRALSQKAGRPLERERFRLNLWVEGLGPWEEFEWVGRRLKIGEARFDVTDRIDRCRATEANPATGRRDVDVMGALRDGWDHIDFGVFLVCTEGGRIAEGDAVRLA